ncbi:MAG: hypothetical protein QXZ44_06235 [Ferroplasma sp.]
MLSFSEAGILRKRAQDFFEETGHLIEIKKYDLAFLIWNSILS